MKEFVIYSIFIGREVLEKEAARRRE